MGRRKDRELAMQILFEKQFNDTEIYKIIECVFNNNNLNEQDKSFINKLVSGTLSNLQKIDDYIERYCKDWNKNRIAKVDLSILRIAIFEMLFDSEVPVNVAINEAVELAKKYSGDESPAFINGVLGAILRENNQRER